MGVVALLSVGLATRAWAEPAKATVYSFFATWCVPCRLELPHLEALHQRYKDRGLLVILVSEDAPSTAQAVPSFLARYNITAKWQLDSDSKLLARYNVSANIPYTVLLDANGTLAWAHAGYEPGDEVELEKQIAAQLLKEGNISDGDGERVASRRSLFVNSQSLGVLRNSRFQLNDERKFAGAERLELGFHSEALTVSARLDGLSIADQVGVASDLSLERALLTYKNRSIELSLGDNYVQLGQGLALSLRKIDSLGVDTTLRGALAQLHRGDFRLSVLAGRTNRQNLDTIDYVLVEDTQDRIVGGEIEVAATEKVSISSYALAVNAQEAASDGKDVDWQVAGASAEFRSEAVVLAAEAAGGTRKGFSAAHDRENIGAVYAAAQWIGSEFSLLADAKAYRNWAIGRIRNSQPVLYHEAPTLEREDQAVPANDNAIGMRVRLEWRIPGKRTTLFANALGYHYTQDGTSALRGGDTALHGYVGSDLRVGKHTSIGLQAGYRDENKSDGSDKINLYHLDLSVATSIRRKLAVTFKWNHVEETKSVFRPLRFRRGLAIVGLAWPAHLTASLLYGYSTEQATTPAHYPGVELLFSLSKGGYLRLFGGRLAGGRVCVSGSCRDVPAFEGARLDLVLSR